MRTDEHKRSYRKSAGQAGERRGIAETAPRGHKEWLAGWEGAAGAAVRSKGDTEARETEQGWGRRVRGSCEGARQARHRPRRRNGTTQGRAGRRRQAHSGMPLSGRSTEPAQLLDSEPEVAASSAIASRSTATTLLKANHSGMSSPGGGGGYEQGGWWVRAGWVGRMGQGGWGGASTPMAPASELSDLAWHPSLDPAAGAKPRSGRRPPRRTRAQHLAELGARQVELVQALALRHVGGHVPLLLGVRLRASGRRQRSCWVNVSSSRRPRAPPPP